MNRAANAYFQTQAATTSQGEILLLLYDGIVKFLTRAKEKIRERDFAAKGIAISKAMDIISELDACLNAEKGGALTENLHRLYAYCNTRLLDANLKMSIPYVDEVIRIIENLRDAYASVINTPEAQNAAKLAPPLSSATRMPNRAPQKTVLGRPVNPSGKTPLLATTRPQQACLAYRHDTECAMQPAGAPSSASAVSESGAASNAQEQGMAASSPQNKQLPAQAAPVQEPLSPLPPAAPSTPQPAKGFSRALAGSSLYRKVARQI